MLDTGRQSGRPGCVVARAVALFALALFSPVLFSLAGCGVTRTVSTKAMLPILHGSLDEAYRDADLATVEDGIPANLILIRGMCASNRGHRELHQLAAQLYFSYALGFVEDEDPTRAGLLYGEGLRLGRQRLEREGWFREAEGTPGGPTSAQLAKMGRDDVPLVFWTLANWGGWINQNLAEPAAIAQTPRVEAYLARVLELEPDYFLGMPHVLAGSLKSFRPVMFGGDPEGGRKHFEEGMRISGNRMLLFPVLYAQYYCRSVLDRDGFVTSLQGALDAPSDLLPEYRLFNEVAKAKAARLLERTDEYF